ncbi:MAG: CcmD family protein [Deltaproteobacteria bacterium]|nr:CcmD family protein [Deltaproteobacteria bacterium]
MKGLYYLAAAYTAVWIAIFGYVMSIGRRARKLERELEELRK